MNDIFSNLVIRNADQPSLEVLKPRLPSLFEPSSLTDGATESTLASSMTFPTRAKTEGETDKTVLPSPGHESPSLINSHTLNEPTILKIVDHSSHERDLESASEITNPLSTPLPLSNISPESVHPSITITSHEEMHDDLRRSATIMSSPERIPARTSANDPHREKFNVEERMVHPRVESVTAHKIDRLVGPSRIVQGRADKSMNVLQPREESNHAESPVVRIHIGRIDVRAFTTPPSQPASNPVPAQPRLTLDDYLRQREGHR